jgi:hypothetical protein
VELPFHKEAARVVMLAFTLRDEPYITKREVISMVLKHAPHRSHQTVKEVWRRLQRAGYFETNGKLVKNLWDTLNRSTMDRSTMDEHNHILDAMRYVTGVNESMLGRMK